MNQLIYWQGLLLALLAIAVILHRSQAVSFRSFAASMALLSVSWLMVGIESLVQFVADTMHYGVATAFANSGVSSLLVVLTLALLLSLLLNLLLTTKNIPPIHDITTDTEDPPRFSKILALREPEHNSLELDPSVINQQKQRYAGINPLFLQRQPDDVFRLALRAANKLGWTIHSSDSAKGLIEAMASTQLFGFVDDVAIRIRPADKGSRIDVRSASRVGQSDLGANAKRVKAFLAVLSLNQSLAL